MGGRERVREHECLPSGGGDPVTSLNLEEKILLSDATTPLKEP